MNSDKHQRSKSTPTLWLLKPNEKKVPSLVPVSVSQYGPTPKFFKT